jgi:hypothetical protein
MLDELRFVAMFGFGTRGDVQPLLLLLNHMAKNVPWHVHFVFVTHSTYKEECITFCLFIKQRVDIIGADCPAIDTYAESREFMSIQYIEVFLSKYGILLNSSAIVVLNLFILDVWTYIVLPNRLRSVIVHPNLPPANLKAKAYLLGTISNHKILVDYLNQSRVDSSDLCWSDFELWLWPVLANSSFMANFAAVVRPATATEEAALFTKIPGPTVLVCCSASMVDQLVVKACRNMDRYKICGFLVPNTNAGGCELYGSSRNKTVACNSNFLVSLLPCPSEFKLNAPGAPCKKLGNGTRCTSFSSSSRPDASSARVPAVASDWEDLSSMLLQWSQRDNECSVGSHSDKLGYVCVDFGSMNAVLLDELALAQKAAEGGAEKKGEADDGDKVAEGAQMGDKSEEGEGKEVYGCGDIRLQRIIRTLLHLSLRTSFRILVLCQGCTKGYLDVCVQVNELEDAILLQKQQLQEQLQEQEQEQEVGIGGPVCRGGGDGSNSGGWARRRPVAETVTLTETVELPAAVEERVAGKRIDKHTWRAQKKKMQRTNDAQYNDTSANTSTGLVIGSNSTGISNKTKADSPCVVPPMDTDIPVEGRWANIALVHHSVCHVQLLRRCVAVIHHGGIGTIGTCLHVGIPQSKSDQ